MASQCNVVNGYFVLNGGVSINNGGCVAMKCDIQGEAGLFAV